MQKKDDRTALELSSILDMEIEIDSAEDQAILSALRTKEHRQAARLMVRYYGNAVFNFCLAQVSDQTLAEDLTQTSFSKAFAQLDQFKGQDSPRSWLMWMAGEVCLEHVEGADLAQGEDDLSTVELDAGLLEPQKISESLRRRLEVLASAL